MINIRYAKETDKEWLLKKDHNVPLSWVDRCLSHQEYLIAEDLNQAVGYLRFSYFWGHIPYMDMIRIDTACQKQGIGTKLFQFWENEMRTKKATVLMTSSVKKELAPQKWHKKNGFEICGEMHFGNFDPSIEVFMIKNL